MPETLYQFASDVLWPLKLAGAVFLAYLIHEWLADKWGGPGDPDGFA